MLSLNEKDHPTFVLEWFPNNDLGVLAVQHNRPLRVVVPRDYRGNAHAVAVEIWTFYLQQGTLVTPCERYVSLNPYAPFFAEGERERLLAIGQPVSIPKETYTQLTVKRGQPGWDELAALLTIREAGGSGV